MKCTQSKQASSVPFYDESLAQQHTFDSDNNKTKANVIMFNSIFNVFKVELRMGKRVSVLEDF
jgi:hypothetical protein